MFQSEVPLVFTKKFNITFKIEYVLRASSTDVGTMTSKTFDERKNMKNVTEMYKSTWLNVQNKQNISKKKFQVQNTHGIQILSVRKNIINEDDVSVLVYIYTTTRLCGFIQM